MILPELPDRHRYPGRRASSQLGLALAALLASLTVVQAAQALGQDRRPTMDISARPTGGWRILRSHQPPPGPSVLLPAAQAWTVHKRTGRRASATLAIRCAPGGRLGLTVSFPDRVWHGGTLVAYKLDSGQARLVRPHAGRASGPTEWLGGDDLVRDLVRADVLVVLVDDLGLGTSEAVFHLGGAKAAVRQADTACEAERAPLVLRVPPEKAEAAQPKQAQPKQAQPKPADQPSEQRQEKHEPVLPAPAAAPQAEEQAPDRREPERPLAEAPPPQGTSAPPASPPLPEPPSSGAPRDPEPEQPASATEAAAAPPEVAVAAPPQPQDRVGDTADARLAAYIRRHGPNRKGELIYGWYRQCLDRAGIEGERVWYLSNEELAYLSRGDTDRVRLSMLISNVPDLDIPPRRITCHGTAQGRDLTIERAE